MKKKIILGMCLLASLITLNACGSKTQNGLKYKVLTKGEGRQAQMGDIIQGKMTLSSQDSILFALNESEKILQIMESIFPGDLNEGLLTMREGDSTQFFIPVDSMAKYMGGGMPEFVKEYLVYTVKIDKLYTEEELQQEENLKAEKARADEQFAIAEYLEANKITVQPDNGIYFIESKKGHGKTVQQGQTVKVNYTGRLLNGKLFDTNIEEVAKENGVYNAQRPYEPMAVPAGMGRMIPGFDYALTLMKKGGKATVIIPFDLAYGSRAVSEDLPAYSTLVFEIEITDVE